MARRKQPTERPKTCTIKDLAQVRVLAHPLRLRILGVLGREAHTTKQVAEILGEKPTRLYHHVEALERAGLLLLTETRPNRGTLERYYRAAGTKFVVAASLLTTTHAAAPGGAAITPAVAAIVETTRQELEAWAARSGPAEEGGDPLPLVARALVAASPERLASLREQLLGWLEKARTCRSEDEAASGALTYAITVAFYPIVRSS
jgi:DNA-binding transcriptional ArsR family regulator